MTPDLRRLCQVVERVGVDPGGEGSAEIIVRAILAELRDVSEAMTEAGQAAQHAFETETSPPEIEPPEGHLTSASHTFTAMIDAVLIEPTTG